MADSLQEQLRALGLAKDQEKKTRKRGKPARKRARGGKGGGRPAESDLERAWRLRREAERAEGERTRREKQQADERNRRLNLELKPLMEDHALNDPEGEEVRNFLDRGKIRALRVTPEQQTAIQSGALGIGYCAGRYYLLPAAQIEAVRKRSPAHVVDLGLEEEGGDDAT